MVASIWQQTVSLFKRNLRLKLRSPVQLWQELLFPVIFVAVLLIISLLLPITTYPAIPSFPEKDPLTSFTPDHPLLLTFSPNSSLEAAVIDRAAQLLTIELGTTVTTQGFASEEDLNDYLFDPSEDFWSAVLLGLSNETAPEVAIRMNSTLVPSTSSSQDLSGVCRLTEDGLPTRCPPNGYMSSGFLLLQAMLNKAVYEEIVLDGADSGIVVEAMVQQMPKEEYQVADVVLGYMAPIYLVLAMSPLFQYLLVNLVVEKEKKMLEIMQMAGMKTVAFHISWMMTYSIAMVIVTLIMSLMLCEGGVFPKSDFFVVFLLLFIYGLALISFGLMISNFFNKSKVAGAVGSFLNVILSIIFLPLSGLGLATPGAALWAASLIPSVSLPIAVSIIVNYEYSGVGIDWTNVGDSSLFTPGYSVSSAMIMLTLDIFIYLFFAWYLEAVLPSSYGTKLPPWFIFLPEYWFPPKQKIDVPKNKERAIDGVEPMPEEMASKAAIQITDLHKRYSGLLCYSEIKYAVNGVTFNLYEDQIFGLLGHNGAGKSSLVSILSGTNPQSSGSISVYGFDTRKQMAQIREMMGVCPQDNVLYDNLTVEEHLTFFGGLRGLQGSQLKDAITEMLHDIDLAELPKARAITLSGGQKRKLCLGMAMIGNPKILLLDEPTSGMDPYSRRKIWDLLQKKKKGHVTLLTTHSMDEADILADRKAVLTAGKVRCIGSSLFLKSKFGLGYHLNILTNGKCDSSAVLNLIQKHVPDARLVKQSGTDQAYTLPLSSSPAFPALFASIEESQSSLNITGFFVSMTSLEEVFLNLQDEEEEEHRKDINPSGNSGVVLSPHPETTVAIEIVIPPVQKEKPTFGTKLRSMIYFRLRQVPRNYRGYVFSVAFPIYFLVIGMVFFTLIPSVTLEEKNLVLSAETYYQEPVFYANETGGSLDPIVTRIPKILIEVAADELYDKYSIGSFYGWGFSVSDNEPAHFQFLSIYNDSLTHVLPASFQALSGAFYSSLAEDLGFGPFQIIMSSFPLPFGQIPFDVTSYVAILMIGNALVFAACGFPSDVVKEREFKLKHQLSVMGLSNVGYWLSNFVRDILLLSIPGILVIILVWAFQVTPFIGPAFLAVFLLIILFMVVMVIFAYILSFAFDHYETSQTVLPVMVNFVGMIPYIIVAGLDLAGIREAARALHYVFCLWNPAYGIYGGLHYISTVNLYAQFSGTTPTVADYFDPANNVLPTLLIFLAQILITGLVCYIVYRRGRVLPKSGVDESTSLLGPVTEQADLNEATRGTIVANHLQKTFPKTIETFDPLKLCKKDQTDDYKTVVSDATLVVQDGECFGLLGPNGAGKTTTLNMLTGAEVPTKGTAFIAGYDIVKSREALFELMGYCPQHDALFDDLTVKEHLQLFATIKGIAKSHIDERVNAYISMLGLSLHANSSAKTLSGGTKRKLSFAISLIGDPSVLVLDEPSSGMDPASRRHMWDLVKKNIAGKASILTTHSMEEAEELSTRIGILIKGRFECMGTSQELKNQFGDGYQLDIKVPVPEVANLKSFVATHFQEHTLVEEHYGRLTYRIKAKEMSLSTIFGLFEENHKSLKIEDYSFSQTTLEQVFISFAKKQNENEGCKAAMF